MIMGVHLVDIAGRIFIPERDDGPIGTKHFLAASHGPFPIDSARCDHYGRQAGRRKRALAIGLSPAAIGPIGRTLMIGNA